jgi:hypothetical protein
MLPAPATMSDDFTMGGRAARSWVDKAAASLGEFVAMSELMAPAVHATARKLKRPSITIAGCR